MKYSAKQHLDGRWGIYHDLKLIATVGCHHTCKQIVSCLTTKSKRQSEKNKCIEKIASVIASE